MIPKIIFQTSKTRPQSYLVDQIRSLSPNWEYRHFIDEDIIQFFKDNYVEEFKDVITVFNQIKSGAHKADLFRYYFLYVNGGVYIDSDGMLEINIENVTQNYSFFSVDSCGVPNSIFQGFIGAVPKHDIIHKALLDVYNLDQDQLSKDYHLLCKNLYHIIHNNYNLLDPNVDIKLYREIPHAQGICKSIDDQNQTIFIHYWQYKDIPRRLPKDENSQKMEKVFTQIYETCHWGNDNNKTYSGSSGHGSDIDVNLNTYVPFLKKFIADQQIHSVADLGCGNFKCGPHIYGDCQSLIYYGYDVYKQLIDCNRSSYKAPKYNFRHLDFCQNKDKLISADLCILKDVLQHWPLSDINAILDYFVETKKYKYILITNCSAQAMHNVDIPTGSWRPLSADFYPLKKYNPVKLYNYAGKEICLITSNQPLYISSNIFMADHFNIVNNYYPFNPLPNQSQIPKKLHMIWLNSTTDPIPRRDYVDQNLQKWKDLMPDWEIKLWTDDNLSECNLSSQALEKINQADKGVQKADIARYFIIEKYGGFYVDADMLPYRSLEGLLSLDQHQLILCHDLEITWQYIINAFFGGVPHHPVLQKACELVLNATLNTWDIHLKTGPQILGQAVYVTPIDNPKHLLIPTQCFYHNDNYPYRFAKHLYAKEW